MTEASRRALEHLRDPSQLGWMVIPLLAITVHVYLQEVERRNWSLVFAGLAFWGMDWLNEIGNAIILHATGRSALWTAPGRSMYLILVGLNVEICFMFSIAGLALARLLPRDAHVRILGVPNRLFIAVTSSAFCVLVEVVLNRAGMLIWEYAFWNVPNVLAIVVFGYLHFHLVAFWVHDLRRVRDKALVVGTIWGLAAAAALVFGVGLRWI